MLPGDKRKLLTTSEVAEVLHCHVNTVRRLSNLGILKTMRIGPRKDRRFYRIDVSNLLTSGQRW